MLIVILSAPEAATRARHAQIAQPTSGAAPSRRRSAPIVGPMARRAAADEVIRQVGQRVAMLRICNALHPKAARHEAPERHCAVEAQLHLEALDADA